MSKVKCFACQKMGHYAGQCPNKKKKKNQHTAATTEIDGFTVRFERYFSLFVGVGVERSSSITSRDFENHMEHSMIVEHSLSATTTSSTWYIDSGASNHMTGDRDMFTEMSESYLELEVVLGDDIVVRAVGRGTARFDRESMHPLYLRDVLYVLGLKKNLVSVSMIEDRGFGVYVLDGKVHIFPKAAGPSYSRVIGVRCGKMYKLLLGPHHALASLAHT